MSSGLDGLPEPTRAPRRVATPHRNLNWHHNVATDTPTATPPLIILHEFDSSQDDDDGWFE